MELRVLGPLQVVDDGRVVAVRGAREQALLAALALGDGQVVAVDHLIDALWGAQPPPSARKLLQNHVLRVRKLLGSGAIETGRDSYVLAGSVVVDVSQFEELVHAGRIEMARQAPSAAAECYRDALALWRGQPFVELADWSRAESEIARLGELRLLAQVGASSGYASVVEVDPASWVATACRLAGRNLTRSEWHSYLPNRAYHQTCAQWPAGT